MLSFKINKKAIAILLLSGCTFSSCRRLVEIGPPVNQVGLDQAFSSDATATSAILGIYNNSSARSMLFPMTEIPGLSSDELQNNIPAAAYDEFGNSAVTITNTLAANLWYYCYAVIAQANAMHAGLERSDKLSASVKNQLLGEAKVWRAFMFFQLVNNFGDVPMPLTDDPIGNATLARTPAATVWVQVIKDLTDATTLLTDAYPSSLRGRINRQVANALLARVYLYTKDYKNAEATASLVIGSGIYSLNKDLNSVFTNTSNEIMWQLATTTGLSIYTTNQDNAGGSFAAPAGSIPGVTLKDTIYNTFEAGDLRKTNWVTRTAIAGSNYNVISKYKQRVVASGATLGTEYNVMLRYAEQFLIRAEARAQQGLNATAIADLDTIRGRAGLPVLNNALDKAGLLAAVEQERKAELFGEWGHRWFDLKRTPSLVSPTSKTRADDVMSGIRPATWTSTDILYPIPDAQRVANPKLTQNPGYTN
ncbi:RagB/SusD family nutrient uptake outer membrane protein [Chitinophaga sp. Cy-1792]|uniref:RagB/SusD family nutrient uptake outer membrane protein n=1 Tax=Chitinophaga sp. Cy-1792 TaxID=2608339 RepID=UPI0014231F6B|nr:RagB/SusD family nutrient uptake outer membrane protein [Chitinophaga sp. Cy-1792]NIG57558.1 RagB/SusD family nutrient uptake outer membrane protein [Chitinophaga sp. Cy-1792]